MGLWHRNHYLLRAARRRRLFHPRRRRVRLEPPQPGRRPRPQPAAPLDLRRLGRRCGVELHRRAPTAAPASTPDGAEPGRWFAINVVGESHVNADGSSRQAIIRKLRASDPLLLVAEPDNPFDGEAVPAKVFDVRGGPGSPFLGVFVRIGK